MKAVLGQGGLGTGHKPRPLESCVLIAHSRLGKPLLSHFAPLGFLPMCWSPFLDQEPREALTFLSWEIFQARREPSLARLAVPRDGQAARRRA